MSEKTTADAPQEVRDILSSTGDTAAAADKMYAVLKRYMQEKIITTGDLSDFIIPTLVASQDIGENGHLVLRLFLDETDKLSLLNKSFPRVLVGTEMPVRISPVSPSMTWIRSLFFMYRSLAGLKATAVRAVVQSQSPTLLASPVARSIVTRSSSMLGPRRGVTWRRGPPNSARACSR